MTSTHCGNLYQSAANSETIAVKRRLWHNLLMASLGEIARGREQMDDLFVRHTYLSLTIGMVVQASFGIDIVEVAESDPAALLNGHHFHNATGLHGIVESDFFAWPAEVEGGLSLVKTLARRVARFDWANAPADVGAILYVTVIPPDERRQLGEYYTPDWLARAMVRELVSDPLNQRVLDPACGSGTFLVEAIAHFLEAAERESLEPAATLERLRVTVTGIDVHPVAVHLARAAWTLAARPAIMAAAADGYNDPISVPVYLGDALQLRFHTGDLFAEKVVTIEVEDEENTTLVFPVSLVARADTFDPLMSDIADAIERGADPRVALDDHTITDPAERETLEQTIAAMQSLHAAGRDHIWAYYTRNLVRPVILSREKVDVIIGNPPWLIYRNTARIMRSELEMQSKRRYNIWAGGKYAAVQDISGLFYARCTDLYLKDGGAIGMVLPHSALRTGQYAKWRTGKWHGKQESGSPSSGFALSVTFKEKAAWDLEGLEPNTFFPMPASVVFARRLDASSDAQAVPLSGKVERWLGKAGAPDVRRNTVTLSDTESSDRSPYDGYSRKGADIYPRRFYFVNEHPNPAVVWTGQTVTVTPRIGAQDKKPWRNLDITALTGQAIEAQHVHEIHLGETVVPYATLDPLKAVLPLRHGDSKLPIEPENRDSINVGALGWRMRDRWQIVCNLWDENKRPVNKLSLLGRLDYHRELSAQLAWQQNPGERPVRVVYTGYGQPTAAIINDDTIIVDYKLFWITCKDEQEAYYLLAIINSETLYEAVEPLMSKGQFGARDLQKHLWKLPIPEFDPAVPLHTPLSPTPAKPPPPARPNNSPISAPNVQIPAARPSAEARAPSPSPSPAANSANGSAPPKKASP